MYFCFSLSDHSLDTSLFVNSSEPVTPSPDPQHYLGDLIGGTFCSRVFTDCNRRDCRLQSPNFPGIYPRNLTCYYAIRQQVCTSQSAILNPSEFTPEVPFYWSVSSLNGFVAIQLHLLLDTLVVEYVCHFTQHGY